MSEMTIIINVDLPLPCSLSSEGGFLYYECSTVAYSTIIQWIAAAITLRKLAQRVLRPVIHFCTECVHSAILLPLTVINTNITMVISKNQLLLRDTQKHCNFWACF